MGKAAVSIMEAVKAGVIRNRGARTVGSPSLGLLLVGPKVLKELVRNNPRKDPMVPKADQIGNPLRKMERLLWSE